MDHAKARSCLGLNPGASDEDIKKAYRQKAMDHHPDRKGGNEELFKLVKEAYDFLRNNKFVEEKSNYTWADEKPVNSGTAFRRGHRPTLDNLDEDGWMNKSSWNGRWSETTSKAATSSTVDTFVNISLEEAFAGCSKETNLPNPSFISEVNHIIRIPRGITEDKCLGVITSGKPGSISQTKYKVFARINSDYLLEKNGDITKDLLISPFLMMVGGWIKITTIDGNLLEVFIPPGLETNKLLKVSGRGYWTGENSRLRGDCYFRAVPNIVELSKIPKDELREFIHAAQKQIDPV